MGFVWAVRRSLRLLTLLTLMASALCTGQTLAAQENAAPRVTLAGSVAHPEPQRGLVATHIFEGESAVTAASAFRTTDTAFHFVFSSTATLAITPGAAPPLPHHFSPLAERAPPAA